MPRTSKQILQCVFPAVEKITYCPDYLNWEELQPRRVGQTAHTMTPYLMLIPVKVKQDINDHRQVYVFLSG